MGKDKNGTFHLLNTKRVALHKLYNSLLNYSCVTMGSFKSVEQEFCSSSKLSHNFWQIHVQGSHAFNLDKISYYSETPNGLILISQTNFSARVWAKPS